MQLTLTILALLCIALGLFIAFAPSSEIDESIREAQRFPAKRDAMGRAIRGDSK